MYYVLENALDGIRVVASFNNKEEAQNYALKMANNFCDYSVVTSVFNC